MIVRIRPEKEWTFDERLAMVAVGSAGSLQGAAMATKLPRKQLLQDLRTAIRKLPGTDLEMREVEYAKLWWRGIPYSTWTGWDHSGREVRTITATIWHDQYEQLREEYRLAKGEPVPQIAADRTQVILDPEA